MYIKSVVSYGNAWNNLVENFSLELSEIKQAVAELTLENIKKTQLLETYPARKDAGLSSIQITECWEGAIQSLGWEDSKNFIENMGARPIRMRGLGFRKNRVSVSFQKNIVLLNSWLYTLAPIATRNGYVDIPVATVMLTETEEALLGRRAFMRAEFERTVDELIALSPLSHSNPFVLLGLSYHPESINIIELEAEGDVESRQIVINRSIEFPPEYHQAGLGILNYFGSVLREKYPDHKAKVKIEQDGLKVRLIIESENGDREIIEKALQEYEMVVRGEVPPETLFKSKAKVLELKSELRIAQVRIEGQRDIIEYQGQEITTLKEIIGHSLSKDIPQSIYLTVSPNIQVSNANSVGVSIESSLPEILNHVQELIDLAAIDPSLQLRLMDLDESLNSAANKKTPDAVRDSVGLQKLRKFIDEASETGTSVNKFFNKVSDGIGLAQKLAKRYNQVAEWCGAPQVPSILLGKDS
ncbi:MAG: hypothetical protein Q7U88_02210 [Desulfocapsaceae bacterium]|nr:hypothetical protein [Desulfocapsaceae bacterium]